MKSRYSFFFTVANPGIASDRAILSSKNEIYQQLSDEIIPKTLLVNTSTTLDECRAFIHQHNLEFPVIAKPDKGLRGIGLHVINNINELGELLKSLNQDYLLQEFVPFDKELGVFVIRQADGTFKITSIVDRAFASITGDGKKTVKELLLSNMRYAMQYEFLVNQQGIDASSILNKGEILEFEKIGNHSKGTIFKDGMHLKSVELLNMLTQNLSTFQGFNFGRLDIKYHNYEDLIQGNNFKVIELNGIYSEPAHIYEHSIFYAWKVILTHFRILYEISMREIHKGNVPADFSSGLRGLIQYFTFKRAVVGGE